MAVKLFAAGKDYHNRRPGIDQRFEVGRFLTGTLSAWGLALRRTLAPMARVLALGRTTGWF